MLKYKIKTPYTKNPASVKEAGFFIYGITYGLINNYFFAHVYTVHVQVYEINTAA